MFDSTSFSAQSLDYIHGGIYTHEDNIQISASLVQDAARILCHSLLFTTEHFLHGFNLAVIYDDCMQTSKGYSFLSEWRNDFTRPELACDIQANIWSKPGLSIEDRATLARVLHEASLDTRTEEIPHHLVQQYENSAHQFLEYLILLVLLTGGQPDGELRVSQGFVSELVSLRITNSKENLRPIYVAHGGVVQIACDNFVTDRTRILPNHVGVMLVVYLMHVRPFIAQISPYSPAASSDFLFPSAQGHWHTDSYTYLITRESQLRLNKNLVLEDINDVHIRYLRITNPASLTKAMWERLNADSGCYTCPVRTSEQLPSSEIVQQWGKFQSRTPSPSLNAPSTIAMASRTPSPAIGDTLPSSSGVLLPYQYSLPLVTAVPQIETSFPRWTSITSSSPSPSPAWTPTSSTGSNDWKAIISPDASFSGPTPLHYFDYTSSAYSSIPGFAPPTAPPSPIKQIPNAEIQGGISVIGFINGYPPQHQKYSANPKSAAKKKRNNKNNKVLNHTPVKKSLKAVKTRERGSRSGSRQQDDNDNDANILLGQ